MRDALRNRSLSREVNERILEITTEMWRDVLEPVAFLCECGNAQCMEIVELAPTDYLAVRSAPNRFLLRRGHEPPGVGEVARSNGYLVAEVGE